MGCTATRQHEGRNNASKTIEKDPYLYDRHDHDEVVIAESGEPGE